MKIAVLTLGTRGDTQPFIALGKALIARGHQVVLGAPEDSRSWIESHGIAFRSIDVDMRSFVESLDGRRAMAGDPRAMARIWRQSIVPLTRKSLDAIWEVARDAEMIIYHPKTAGAVDVAQATGASLIHAAPFPIFPTKAFPLFVFPGSYGPWLNRLTYRALAGSRLLLRPTVNQWRKDVLGLRSGSVLGRPSGSAGRSPVQLCAASPAVLPDYPADASENIHTTGYWFLDEGHGWQPDPELSAFLEEGDPPVYIGFGSMTSADPAALGQIIVEGVRRSGVRALLATGWGAIEGTSLPDTVHVISGAPHDALFSRVSAVVHHGGSGTTAAGLRAGLPTLVCPLSVDQPFWARRVHALGCGPKPLPLKRLRPGRLADGLARLTGTPRYRVRAEELAGAISAEDGVGRAIDVVEACECG